MILNIHGSGKFRIGKTKPPWMEGKFKYLKLMNREILIEICLKSADGNRKEAENQKWVFEWYPKGANMH